MEPSPTSKVAVTYWDPAALYPLIAPDLRSHLPLRNLHWKSPTRPLRSINSLHVDLLPYSPSPTTLASPVASAELTRVKSSDSAHSLERSASRSRGPRKERRHQIPGLRNTPYLKVYILRCDDNDSYKNTQRKLLREWITTHANGDGSDNHDAFEWLILHVVLPGTPAAQQPRSNTTAGAQGGGSRWMKSGSVSLFDKIRSDFNGSNAKVDRVVQVRIAPNHPALATLSPPVGSSAGPQESPAEAETAWLELVAKLKILILASFDARVGQYEEDVRERDSQRKLPGWNFCTFFVLKEGLARAFESVGLVEDALVLYDELGFGMEAIVREQETRGAVIGGSFIGWTKEGRHWLQQAKNCLIGRKTGEEDGLPAELDDDGANPIASDKKPYRDLILNNAISIFDFRCYLFSRQVTLLLRLGRRGSEPTAQETASGDGEGDDLLRLAEVCRRSIEFVTTVGRVLRTDLTSTADEPRGKKPPVDDRVSAKELEGIIDNLVFSWAYSVCTQLLGETVSAVLPEGLEQGSEKGLLPVRRSSLAGLKTPGFSQPINGNITGLEEIASARADLIVLARTVLEAAAKRRGWGGRETWYSVVGGMEDVDLDGDGEGEKRPVWVPEGIRNRGLKKAIGGTDADSFYEQFSQLSESAMKHYGVAKRLKSAERVESDLAALKFHLKEYETAAIYLQRMTNFYEEQGWGLIETTLLGMYAKCLKEMQKPEEYVNVLLKLLTKSASAENIRVRRRAGKDGNETAPTQPPVQSTVEHVDVHGYVAELVALSNEVSGEIITPMTNLWSDMAVDLYPRHFSDRDGFEVTVKLRYLLSDQLPIDRITVKVVSVATSQSRELVLESTAPVIMRTGIVRAVVSTAQTIPGSYIAEQLEISVGKLRFVHDFMAKTTPATPLGIINSNSAVAITAAKRNKLSFFPAPRALKGRLEMPKGINLERMRSVEVVIDVGDNNVFKGELRIRSATAGLRLITGSLEVMSATDAIIVDPATPGTLGLMEIPAGSEIRIRLPYNSDNELTELMIRIEVDYRTENGTFGFVDTLSVLVALPLAVNVQDIFKDNALYSKFQVSTAAAEVPLRVFSAKLEEGRGFAIEGGKGTVGSMTVFAKQPANFLYKIKKTSEGGLLESLQLVIEYTNMDEELRETLASIFETELRKAGLEIYMQWLIPSLFLHFRHRSPTELETAALLEEFEIGTYEDYGWEDALEAIDPGTGERAKVESWLREFFTTHALIPLNTPAILERIIRTITIPVEVPPLQVLHTVELNLACDSTARELGAPYSPPMVTVGTPLVAELVIRHSRTWDPHPPARDAPVLSFFYEVQNNPDTWLVSGRKRAHFVGEHGAVGRFPLILVPAKAGYLQLPNIEVKCVDGGDEVGCETEYKAGAGVVLVLPDVRSTTVRIGNAHADGV